MPQMGSLLWFNLFLMFILGYTLFSIINFFSKLLIKTETFIHKPTLLEKPWKWYQDYSPFLNHPQAFSHSI